MSSTRVWAAKTSSSVLRSTSGRVLIASPGYRYVTLAMRLFRSAGSGYCRSKSASASAQRDAVESLVLGDQVGIGAAAGPAEEAPAAFQMALFRALILSSTCSRVPARDESTCR